MIIDTGPTSRIDISKKLRISRPTTSVYIGELIKDNLIKEVGKGNSTRYGGKKAVLLQFNRRAGYILGVMIGVKTIRTALTDLESKIVEKIKIPTEEWLGPKAVIDKIVKSLKEIIKISGVNKEKIIGVVFNGYDRSLKSYDRYYKKYYKSRSSPVQRSKVQI